MGHPSESTHNDAPSTAVRPQAVLRSGPSQRIERNRDVPGRAQRESSLLKPLDAKFLKKHPRKQKKQRDNKRKTQKGAISNLVRKGTFLFLFDRAVSLR